MGRPWRSAPIWQRITRSRACCPWRLRAWSAALSDQQRVRVRARQLGRGDVSVMAAAHGGQRARPSAAHAELPPAASRRRRRQRDQHHRRAGLEPTPHFRLLYGEQIRPLDPDPHPRSRTRTAVRINGIGPGETLPSFHQTEQSFARLCATMPLGRGTTPEEICEAVRFILGARDDGTDDRPGRRPASGLASAGPGRSHGRQLTDRCRAEAAGQLVVDARSRASERARPSAPAVGRSVASSLSCCSNSLAGTGRPK